MLIEFTVKNYRSFRDQANFTMVKSQGEELLSTNTFNPHVPKTPDLLRSSVIYGANSSGKSNLIKALKYMKFLVINSTNFKPNQKIPTDLFSFDRESKDLPIEIGISIIASAANHVETSETAINSDNQKLIRYDYGLIFDKEHIIEEWLHAYPKGRVQEWFYRKYDQSKKNGYDYTFSSLFKGNKSDWESNTRPNVLFLSNAVNLNSEQLKPIYDWFDQKLHITTDTSSHFGEGYTKSICSESTYKKQILDFLKYADIGIDDFLVKKEEIDVDKLSFPVGIPEEIKSQIIKDFKEGGIIDLQSVREIDGQNKVIDFEEESEGTKKIFSLAGPIIDTLNEGSILVLDELHNHLHPKLVRFLIEKFHDNDANKTNAQLIFTTHDTHLMKKDLFRRDQIWFVEKDESYASRIYSLHDFSVRKDRSESYEAQYLKGLFGAVPFIDSQSNFLKAEQ
ncbi:MULTISPECIES: ATP/GTP-binding protein [unclassified Psychrobacter]|jgi:AAA15 family ATPase/GTPase|uniref:AAA family ATPase n=1 Tax=Psychrobacter TaxID=497 RepID=UPI000C32DFAA|nr:MULTISPECIES: ATP-binding protein [unclassified Psychrobacter]MBA6245452.1 ATP-binding protein [Psychrobacter sp. Urea-trap-18]MBA6287148.1 ATP-binding protein [Psychrobacter sp. Urea-trap-16]MBA6319115.1 ATP-binding protein [Psychrobacter sp. Urea-trap-20]MBA6333164.1 ATP-binding protein [Psychrobacter sp. Urea-trap-19]PKG61769.1 ATP-binding protein [Psychrobacter sp. Choline-3u-12]